MFDLDFKKKTRVVEYFFPLKIHNEYFFLYCKSHVPLINKTTTVYETIEIYEKMTFPYIQTQLIKASKKRIPIRSLINIHDEDGIKDIRQIRNFFSKIMHGGNIVKSNGFPNIKIARVREKNLLVFDGHHSLLAYMASGKIFLDQIPHIVVSGNRSILKNAEILVFWGPHAPEISASHWKNWVINWQTQGKNQIKIRTRRNMGELFDVLRKKIEP